MKTKILSILLAVLSLPALVFANNTTPVLICINSGPGTPPSINAAGYIVIGIRINGSANFGVACNVNELGVGAQAVNWYDYGSAILPVSSAAVAYSSGCVVDSLTGPVADVNNSPIFTLYFHWPVAVPCVTNLMFTRKNTSGAWVVMAVVDNTAQSPQPVAGSESFVAPGGTYSFPMAAVPCADVVKYSIWSTGASGDDSIHDTGQGADGQSNGNGTNPQPPSNAASNSIPVYSGTNAVALPSVVAPTNIVMWGTNTTTATTGDGSAIVNAIKQAENLQYSQNASGQNQAHNDAVAIKNAINNKVIPTNAPTVLNTSNLATQATLQQVASALTMTTNLSNQAATAQNTQNGISNLLVGIGNHVTTNQGSVLMSNYNLETTQTNVLNAAQAATNILSVIATNLAGLNGLNNILSNLTDVTNMDVASESTLRGMSNLLARASTNSGNLTLSNYNLETTQSKVLDTLVGMSNWIASSITNLDTNHIAGEAGQGYAAAAAGTNLIGGLAPAEMSQDERVGSPLSGWSVEIPYAGGYVLDLNPFHLSWVASLASFTRWLLTWLFAASLLYANIDVLLKALQSLGATRQATASGQEILGTNANLVTALMMAALITIAMLAVPAFAAIWLNSHTADGYGLRALIGMNPFTGSAAQACGAALYILDQFFPLTFMVYCVGAGVIYRAGLGAVIWSVQTVTRFLVG